MLIKHNLKLSILLFAGIFVSACSQNSGNVGGQQNGGSASQVAKQEPKTVVSADTHTHPANECTNSVEHSHPNGSRPHKHYYSCKPNSPRKAVMAHKQYPGERHTHPANKCTRTISHTHPNGKRAHTHHYSCKANRKMTHHTAPRRHYAADAHTHPANKCTRTISHAHPNGKRAHTHHYSCKAKAKAQRSFTCSAKPTAPRPYYDPANAHTHPANKCTRTISHSHPNGKRKHKHHYSCKRVPGLKRANTNSCQANPVMNKGNPNTHTHPANSRTNSTTHTHPNGARPHTHHYG